MIYPGIRSEIGSAIRTAHDRVLNTIKLEVELAAFFASGVKGAWYERSNSATRFQDSTGITPALAASNPVGLMLSMDKALALGPELTTNGGLDSDSAWTKDASVTITGGRAVFTGGSGNPIFSQNMALVGGRTYLVAIIVAAFTSGAWAVRTYGSGGNAVVQSINAVGTFVSRGTWRADATGLFGLSANAVGSIESISVREILGNHQLQATAGARPLFQAGPSRLVFDGVDDVLATTFPAALGATCTVGRSIPGTGAVITSGVNIGTTFIDNVTAGALLIAERALTAGETALWTAYLNQQASL